MNTMSKNLKNKIKDYKWTSKELPTVKILRTFTKRLKNHKSRKKLEMKWL